VVEVGSKKKKVNPIGGGVGGKKGLGNLGNLRWRSGVGTPMTGRSEATTPLDEDDEGEGEGMEVNGVGSGGGDAAGTGVVRKEIITCKLSVLSLLCERHDVCWQERQADQESHQITHPLLHHHYSLLRSTVTSPDSMRIIQTREQSFGTRAWRCGMSCGDW